MNSINSLNKPEISLERSSFVLPRRDFLRSTAAFAMGTVLCGCSQQHSKEHVVDKRSLILAKQREHAFHRNPETWLNENAHKLEKAFDMTRVSVQAIKEFCVEDCLNIVPQPGVRIRRTPGSNILTGDDDHLASIVENIHMLSEQAHHEVRYEAFSHEDCGACVVYADQENIKDGHPDHHGSVEIQDRVSKLQDRGVTALYGGNIPLSALKIPKDIRHPACNAIIDGTVGRLQNHRAAGLPDSFVVSSHDEEEILGGMRISMAVAGGVKGYDKALDGFSFLVFHDESQQEISDFIERSLKTIEKESKIPVRISRVNAPRI